MGRRGRISNTKSSINIGNDEIMDNSIEQGDNIVENCDKLPAKMEDLSATFTPPTRRGRGRPSKTSVHETDCNLSITMQPQQTVTVTEMPENVEVISQAPPTTEVTDCRRSSRKKVPKFDVRDLLNKNRKSKIQIEARIDSNAPRPGEPAKNPIEVENNKKNFIEKIAIFRRFSMSENKAPVKPTLPASPVAQPIVLPHLYRKSEIGRVDPVTTGPRKPVGSLIQESIDTRKPSTSPTASKRRGRPKKNKEQAEEIVDLEADVIDLDEIEDSCDSTSTPKLTNKRVECLKLAPNNDCSNSSDEVVIVSVETSDNKIPTEQPVVDSENSLQEIEVGGEFFPLLEVVEESKPNPIKTYSRNTRRKIAETRTQVVYETVEVVAEVEVETMPDVEKSSEVTRRSLRHSHSSTSSNEQIMPGSNQAAIAINPKLCNSPTDHFANCRVTLVKMEDQLDSFQVAQFLKVASNNPKSTEVVNVKKSARSGVRASPRSKKTNLSELCDLEKKSAYSQKEEKSDEVVGNNVIVEIDVTAEVVVDYSVNDDIDVLVDNVDIDVLQSPDAKHVKTELAEVEDNSKLVNSEEIEERTLKKELDAKIEEQLQIKCEYEAKTEHLKMKVEVTDDALDKENKTTLESEESSKNAKFVKEEMVEQYTKGPSDLSNDQLQVESIRELSVKETETKTELESKLEKQVRNVCLETNEPVITDSSDLNTDQIQVEHMREPSGETTDTKTVSEEKSYKHLRKREDKTKKFQTKIIKNNAVRKTVTVLEVPPITATGAVGTKKVQRKAQSKQLNEMNAPIPVTITDVEQEKNIIEEAQSKRTQLVDIFKNVDVVEVKAKKNKSKNGKGTTSVDPIVEKESTNEMSQGKKIKDSINVSTEGKRDTESLNHLSDEKIIKVARKSKKRKEKCQEVATRDIEPVREGNLNNGLVPIKLEENYTMSDTTEVAINDDVDSNDVTEKIILDLDIKPSENTISTESHVAASEICLDKSVEKIMQLETVNKANQLEASSNPIDVTNIYKDLAEDIIHIKEELVTNIEGTMGPTTTEIIAKVDKPTKVQKVRKSRWGHALEAKVTDEPPIFDAPIGETVLAETIPKVQKEDNDSAVRKSTASEEKKCKEANDPLSDIEKFIAAGENLLNQSLSEGEEDNNVRRPKSALSSQLSETFETKPEEDEKIEEVIKQELQIENVELLQPDENTLSNADRVKSENKILIKQILEEIKSTLDPPKHSDSSTNNIRRSHRLQTISKSKSVVKVGRGLVRDRDRFKDENGMDDYITDLKELDAVNLKFLKDMEERLSQFKVIRYNEYKCDRVVSKEARNMECDCFLTREEEERGEFGCGEDCLNRMLLIECGDECAVAERCTNKRFQKFLYSPCKVFRTEKKGFGIAADSVIYPGDFVMEYVGEVINSEQFEKRRYDYSLDKNIHHYFMELRSDAIIDATTRGNISRFINHSCDPNATTQKWTINGELRIGFFCIKRIMPGEEITFDYQFQRYGKEAQKCFCESSNCRGWIGTGPDSGDEDEEDESESEEDMEEIINELDKHKEKVEKVEVGKQVSDEVKIEVKPTEVKVVSPLPKKQKEKSKKRRQIVNEEDPDVETDVHSLLRTGLKNQSHTLCLSRLMVRSKLVDTRMKLLDVLRVGETVCKRLFLDYHGLRFLHGWMSEMTDSSISQKELELRMSLLQALEVLPIQNKTSLKDSHVYDIVQSWSTQKSSSSTSGESGSSALDSEIQKLAFKLVTAWDQLPEVFKIPKRERAEQMKEHEREADRQYKALNLGDDDRRAITSRDKDRFGKRKRSFDKEERKTSKFKWTREKYASKEGNTPDSSLSKVERRQLFAEQVAREEARKRMIEEQHGYFAKCNLFRPNHSHLHTYFENQFPIVHNPAAAQWYPLMNNKFQVHTPSIYQQTQPCPLPPKPELPTHPKFYNLPDFVLPPDWKYAIDRRGRLYYYNSKIRISQWTIPEWTTPEWTMPSDIHMKSSADADDSDISASDSELLDLDINSEKFSDLLSHITEKRRRKRSGRLTQERAISPRREDDRKENKIAMKSYKENKEKIKRRKEEIRRRKAMAMQEGGLPLNLKSDQGETSDDDPTALPIQDYLISSDEEEDESIEENCNSQWIDRIVQGDKPLEDLDALKIRKSLKRPPPVTEKHDSKKGKVEKIANKLSEDSNKGKRNEVDDKTYRKSKDQFRIGIGGIIRKHLKRYQEDQCKNGRITNSDDFNHLSRKLTHFVMVKELKHCESIGQALVVSESVKNKSREFIRKYMSKYGEVYVRPENDPEFRDIQ